MIRHCKNAIALSLVLLLTLASACATHSRTVTRETTYYSEDRRYADPVVERRTTETRVESDSDEPRGVVSGTVNTVGEIVALPFRAVGGLIRAIF